MTIMILKCSTGHVGQNRQLFYLGTFTETPGVKQTPSIQAKVSEVSKLFFKDFFIFYGETNL